MTIQLKEIAASRSTERTVSSPIPEGTNYPETPESVALALLIVTVNKAPEHRREIFDLYEECLRVVAGEHAPSRGLPGGGLH